MSRIRSASAEREAFADKGCLHFRLKLMQLSALFGRASQWKERAGAAMPEAVTALSDDDKPRAVPKKKPTEKTQPKAKAGLKRPAKKEPETGDREAEKQELVATNEPQGKAEPKQGLKRPAAAEESGLRAYKSMYKDGKWGIKLKGAGEQMTAWASMNNETVEAHGSGEASRAPHHGPS